MKCADPVLRYTTDSGKKIYRNFSLANYIVKKCHDKVFDCGKCLNCRRKKSFELARRCVLHASSYRANSFITLTYDHIDNPDMEYDHIQKFKKKLRSYVYRTFGKRVEIFNVHEYGKGGRKHWHLIVFNHDFKKDVVKKKIVEKKLYTIKNQNWIYTSEKLTELWKFGYHTIGDVSIASAMYQAQYMEKDFKNGNITNKRKSNSKHSGLGKPYFYQNYKQILRLGYIPIEGKKMPLPRYFEKLAHKHYCHYYDQEKFFDTPDRKPVYRPFKLGAENKEIADLFIDYKKLKDIKIEKLEKEWNEVISHYFEGKQPEFIQAGVNALYDLKNKTAQEIF